MRQLILFIVFTLVCFSLMDVPALKAGETKTAKNKKKAVVASAKKEPFKASSLWGVRRGPNAPKPEESIAVKSQAELGLERDKKMQAEALSRFYEQKAMDAYSRGTFPEGRQTMVSGSEEECKTK